jgi:hypothetical protein
MQKQVRKSVLGVLLVAALSMTVPAMAAPHGGSAPHDLFTRIRQFIAHILDDVVPTDPPPPGLKATQPPG